MIQAYEIKQKVNPETLTQELQAEFGPDVVIGVSRYGEDAGLLHFQGDITDDMKSRAKAVLQAHDPGKLSDRQQEENAARQSSSYLLGVISDRITWHENNPPTTTAEALEAIKRMQVEWLTFMKWLRGSGLMGE